MTWLTWRQTRTPAYVLFLGVVVLAAIGVFTHAHLVRLAGTGTAVYDLLSPNDRRLYYAGVMLLALAPAIIGAFLGAPLVARELEHGTHRLVWNQSITRRRWLGFRLAAVAAVAAAAVGLLSWVITWWSALLDGAEGERGGSLPARMTPIAFSMRGLVPVGYAVLAICIGVAAGLVLRRTVPAMAIVFGLVAAVQIVMPLVVRPHLIPAETTVVAFDRAHLDYIRNNPNGAIPQIAMTSGTSDAWILSQRMVDNTGSATSTPAWFADCLPKVDEQQRAGRPNGADPLDSCFARLNDEGYRQLLVYQPASAFWPLQWAETGLLVLLSGLLTGFSFWWLGKEG